jgi:hypothetical protein
MNTLAPFRKFLYFLAEVFCFFALYEFFVPSVLGNSWSLLGNETSGPLQFAALGSATLAGLGLFVQKLERN